MNLMAVPAALMSMVSGMWRSASMITVVSSQSLRLLGRVVPPDSEYIISARFDMLFDAGNLTSVFSRAGAVIWYFFIRFFGFLLQRYPFYG